MKNMLGTLISLIAVIVFAGLAAVLDKSGHIAAALVMLAMGGVSIIAFMNFEASSHK